MSPFEGISVVFAQWAPRRDGYAKRVGVNGSKPCPIHMCR